MTVSAFGVDHGYEEISKVSLGGMLKPIQGFAGGVKGGFQGKAKMGTPMSTSFNRGAKLGGKTASGLKAVGADTGQIASRLGMPKMGTKMQANPLKTGAAVAGAGGAGAAGGGMALSNRRKPPMR